MASLTRAPPAEDRTIPSGPAARWSAYKSLSIPLNLLNGLFERNGLVARCLGGIVGTDGLEFFRFFQQSLVLRDVQYDGLLLSVIVHNEPMLRNCHDNLPFHGATD